MMANKIKLGVGWFVAVAFVIFAAHVHAFATTLEAVSAGIDVRELPKLEIINIDIVKGIVSIAAPGKDKEINAELKAVVAVTTAGGNLLETVEVKVADPADIRVIFKAPLKPSYIITAKLKNNEVQSNEADIAVTTILDLVPPVVTDIEFKEIQDTSFLRGLINLFSKNSYNSKIQATITATDETELSELFYCVTPSSEIPDGTQWLKTTGVINFDNEMTGTIHAKATDVASNESAIISKPILIDRTPPVISFEIAPRTNDYEPAIIRLTVEEAENAIGISGIDYITNPRGEKVAAANSLSEYFEFVVFENGSYQFSASDKAGNSQNILVPIDFIKQIKKSDWDNNQIFIDAVQQATGKQRIEDVTYTDLQKITTLDLSAKGLTTIPFFLKYLNNLEHLDLRGNEFEVVPDCVYELIQLKYLDLSNNNLTMLDDKIVELRKLEMLDISLNYFVDYELPVIVPNYRDVGNFTNNRQPEQYSFTLLPPEISKEYIGNTTQYTVEWTYDSQPISGNLEQHRKDLFRKLYPAYRTYRPMLYKYNIKNGTIKTATADYAQVYLPEAGVTSVELQLGAAS